VLGGGGARGTAHIGVLEVLERLRIPVDCVAGTSMGALIAGAWASGLGTEQMRARMAKVDWRDLFQDNPSHAHMNYRERRLAQSYYPGLELGVTGKRLRTIHGVVGGQKIKLFINTLVGADRGERSIESLPVPVAIVATDIGTGEKMVFRSGDLASAMRASMSVPALLSPVPYRGHNLVDGGLVDNLPVDEVKVTCRPDVVIAVDVGTPLAPPGQVDTIGAVTGQMIGLLTTRNTAVSRGLIEPGDVYIRPDLAGISATDFDKFREGAARGRQAAEAQAAQLNRYAVSEEAYAAWERKRQSPSAPLPRVDEVRIAPLRHVNPEFVARHVHVRAGDRLDPVQIEQDLGQVYGDGDFENVDYSLLNTRGRAILRIIPVEKSWGPDYLRSGVFVEAANKATEFGVRVAYHRKWLNSLGGEWLGGVQLGERPTLFTEFYQPFDPRQRFFAEPAVGISRERVNIFQDDHRIAEYQTRQANASVNVGANVGPVGALRLGYLYRKRDASVETGSINLPTGKSVLRGWQAVADFDQFDRPFFPTHGWLARVAYYAAQDRDYSRLSADLRVAHAWDPYVINARFYSLSSPKGDLPIADAGSLGGFLMLSGYVRDQILADDIRFASIRSERVIGRMPLGLAGDLRVGVSLEMGRTRRRFTETHVAGWQKAGALYLGGETPVGPLFVGYGYAKGGHSSLYLFLGLPQRTPDG